MKKCLTIIISICLFFSVSYVMKVQSASSGTWSGTIYDIRTGKPLVGVEVKAGVRGRTDPFPAYKAYTNSKGQFSITWDEESWKVWKASTINHYLRINTWGSHPDNHSYFPLTLIRRQPTNISAYLTPRGAYIKGKLYSAETGNPLPETKVQILAPGRVVQSVFTDKSGNFAFKPVIAYSFPIPSELYDVDPANLSDEQPRVPTKNQSYCLTLDGSFANIQPERKGDEFVTPLPLQSSYTDAIHTYVTLRVPKAGQPLPPNAVSPEIVGKAEEAFTLRAYPGDNKVFLEWTAPKDTSNIIGYNLYRKTSQMPYGSPITDFPIKTLNHLDENVENGIYTCYHMKAVYKDKSESSQSNEVCVTPNPQKPIINIPDNATTNQSNYTFTGKVDPGSLVTVNGSKIVVGSDGSFTATVKLNSGKNSIKIVITNKAGDSVTITKTVTLTTGADGKIRILLKIGSKNAYVNNQLVVLDVAPFIDRGRTFVPFRFIGESLGAEVGYTTNSSGRVDTVSYKLGKTSILLYIGKKNATVNGKSVMMDVPPQIIQGRTVVPLRFVTENLGCKVDWDGEKMEILITYPA